MSTFAKLAAVGAVAALSGLGIGLAVSAGPADATQPGGPSHAADMMGGDMTGMPGMGSMSAMAGMSDPSDGGAAMMPMPMSGNSMAEMPASMQRMHDAMPPSLQKACDEMMAASSSAADPGSHPAGGVGPVGHEGHHP